MTERESSGSIDDMAALWAARVDARPLSSQEDADFEAWLSTDTRRQGAFARARAIALYMARTEQLGRSFFDGPVLED